MNVLLCGWDGYIGYPLTLRLLKEKFNVIGLDNYTRRNLVEVEIGSDSALPIKKPNKRTEFLKSLGSFEKYNVDIADSHSLNELFYKKIDIKNIDIIINLSHQPSGPFSLISHETAEFSLINNILGTNNLLWLLKDNPNIHYITIGTTGEYDHYSNIDIAEGYCEINFNGRESNEIIYPRRPTSIYHTSKTSSTYLIDYLTRLWDLKCTDVMQAVVFGTYTDELYQLNETTRFDIDEYFGTLINRFIFQSFINEPLTVYGEGKHQRGFLSLNDSIQALMIAVNNPAQKGKVQTWNQLSEWYSINKIAEIINEIKPSKIKHIKTPRKEFTGEHYYKYITENLDNLGYKPTRTIKEEIEYSFNLFEEKFDWSLKDKLKEFIIPKLDFEKGYKN